MTAAQLKTERERLGLTQAVLAERLGVTARTIQRWEAGYPIPTAITLAIRQLERRSGRRRQ